MPGAGFHYAPVIVCIGINQDGLRMRLGNHVVEAGKQHGRMEAVSCSLLAKAASHLARRRRRFRSQRCGGTARGIRARAHAPVPQFLRAKAPVQPGLRMPAGIKNAENKAIDAIRIMRPPAWNQSIMVNRKFCLTEWPSYRVQIHASTLINQLIAANRFTGHVIDMAICRFPCGIRTRGLSNLLPDTGRCHSNQV